MKLLKEMDGTSKQTQKVVARYRKQWRDYMQWCRPLTEERIGAANYSRYYQSTFAEFEHLLPELPVFEQAANNNNFHRLPFALSQYRVLLGEFGYTQEVAFETLDALVSEQCRQEALQRIDERGLFRLDREQGRMLGFEPLPKDKEGETRNGIVHLCI